MIIFQQDWTRHAPSSASVDLDRPVSRNVDPSSTVVADPRSHLQNPWPNTVVVGALVYVVRGIPNIHLTLCRNKLNPVPTAQCCGHDIGTGVAGSEAEAGGGIGAQCARLSQCQYCVHRPIS